MIVAFSRKTVYLCNEDNMRNFIIWNDWIVIGICVISYFILVLVIIFEAVFIIWIWISPDRDWVQILLTQFEVKLFTIVRFRNKFWFRFGCFSFLTNSLFVRELFHRSIAWFGWSHSFLFSDWIFWVSIVFEWLRPSSKLPFIQSGSSSPESESLSCFSKNQIESRESKNQNYLLAQELHFWEN